MPALSASEARDASAHLTADDIEAIIDRKIAKAVEADIVDTIVVSDRDLGRGTAVWSYVVAGGTGSALLDEVCDRYRAAGYAVSITTAPTFKIDCLDARTHCITISWAARAEQALAA